MENKTLKYFGMGLNVLISVFLALIEIYINQVSDSIIMDIILIICGTLFSWIFISQQLSWNKDISPILFWVLCIKRITLFGIYRSEFIYFLFGYLNGIYSNRQEIKDSKRYFGKAKTVLQILLMISLIIFNFQANIIQHQIIVIIFYIILFVFQGIQDNIQIQPMISKQVNYNSDQRNTQATEFKKCQTIIQQNQQTKSLWEQFNDKTDDWICQIEITKFTLNSNCQSKLLSLVFEKFLKENKLNLLTFFNHLKIDAQSLDRSQFKFDENYSFQAWLEKYYFFEYSQQKQQKKKQIQNFHQQEQEDQQSIFSPQNEAQYIYPKDKSQDYSVQQVNSLNVNLKELNQKTNLRCNLCLNQLNYDLQVTIFSVDDSFNEKKQQSLIIHIKNFSQIGKDEVLEQQRQILQRFICKMENHSCQVLKQVKEMKKSFQIQQKLFERIKLCNLSSQCFSHDTPLIKSENGIGDPNQVNLKITKQSSRQNVIQNPTSSNSNNQDFSDDTFQKLSNKYIQQQIELIKQVDKIIFDLKLIKQNNFNFFDLFRLPNLCIEQISILKIFNIVKEIFQQNPLLDEHSIRIILETNSENKLVIESDRRKIKQILINIINNSIQKFDLNQNQSKQEDDISQTQQRQTIKKQDLIYQNMIIIKTKCEIDKIIVEISDNFGGIDQESLNNRLNNCKFGLAACQKLLKYLAYDPKKPLEIINYVKSNTNIKGTIVKFALAKIIDKENFELLEVNQQQESLIVSNQQML